jgi:transcriptional regulator with XRE-family HTH domain
MNHEPRLFGEELRRKRLSAGLSLAQLAHIVHYSKAQLSKVECGIKTPSPELARLCDAALDADGGLASLANSIPSSRRQVLAVGALAAPVICLRNGSTAYGDSTHADLARVFRDQLGLYRGLGQTIDPALLVPVLSGQLMVIKQIAAHTGERAGQSLLIIASRYSEYTGWLVQETGSDGGALRWTRQAIDLGNAAGDSDLAAYGFVRHALMTLYRGDATQTTQLAKLAQASSLPPRIRGLAAAREAQGHAIGADYNSAMRALDRASALLGAAAQDAGQPDIGTANLVDPAEMIRGWCLYDLGRPRDAARVIDQQLPTIPDGATRSRARYGVRRALAYATAGDIDHACQLTSGLLGDLMQIRSATITTDVRALARTLGRHRKNPAVRDLSPELGTALLAGTR